MSEEQDFIQMDYIDILVAGQRVESDIQAELTITHVDKELRVVPAQMNRWAAVWAAAEAEYAQIDAQYRAWRGSMVEAILSGDPKRAEWKVRAEIEADPQFMKFKNALALALRNKTRSHAIFQSFETKARLLQTKGANARAELSKTGGGSYVTDEDEDEGDESPPPTKVTRAARTQRLKDKMRKKRETKTTEEND